MTITIFISVALGLFGVSLGVYVLLDGKKADKREIDRIYDVLDEIKTDIKTLLK